MRLTTRCALLALLVLGVPSDVVRACTLDPIADIKGPVNPWCVYPGHSITFDGSDSYDPDGWLIEWEWDFGDGSSIGGQGYPPAWNSPDPVVHSYSGAPRCYYPKLTVWDNSGASDYKCTTVYVVQMEFSASPTFPYVQVNDDDDDADGVMDAYQDHPVSNDDDLVPVNLFAYSPTWDQTSLSTPDYTGGTLQVWNAGGDLLIGNGAFSHAWWGSAIGTDVYVEGVWASTGREIDDPKLFWDLLGQGQYLLDGWNGNPDLSRQWWTVVHVDMDLDGVADDAYVSHDTEETTPGGFIPLGDFRQLTVRAVQPNTVEDEPDPAAWRQMYLSIETSGDGQIEVWNADKTQQINLSNPLPCTTSDITLWVKGTHESSAQCDIKLVLTHGATNFKDKINLTIVKIEIDSVGFTQDYMITKWPIDVRIDDPDGSAPVWTSGGVSDPVCYARNTPPTMFAAFTVTPSVPEAGIGGINLRARIGSTVIGSASGCRLRLGAMEDGSSIDGWVDGIAGGSPVPNSNGVKTLTPTFTWEISLDGSTWLSVGSSGAHTMYWTDSSGPVANPLYDFGLEKACGYVDGDANIGGKINNGLAYEIWYDPAGPHHEDLSIFVAGTGECCCHTAVFSLLVSHVTCYVPPLTYVWGGCSYSSICYYQLGTWCGPSLQCDRPSCDDAGYHPHFTYHVQTVYYSVIYDPSYGLTGWPNFLCFAPSVAWVHPTAASDQRGPDLEGLTEHWVHYGCVAP